MPWALPRGSPRGIAAPAGAVSVRVRHHFQTGPIKPVCPKITGAGHNKNCYDQHPYSSCGCGLPCYFFNVPDRTILHYFFFVPVIGIPDDLLRSNDATIQTAYRAPEVQSPVIKPLCLFDRSCPRYAVLCLVHRLNTCPVDCNLFHRDHLCRDSFFNRSIFSRLPDVFPDDRHMVSILGITIGRDAKFILIRQIRIGIFQTLCHDVRTKREKRFHVFPILIFYRFN